MKMQMPVLTEAEEQTLLFRWAELQRGRWPELDMLYHVPNGGSRNTVEAARLKAQGVKAGVPDIWLPVARGRYHGLVIELKRVKGGRTSREQVQWITSLNAHGYRATVCHGWLEAKAEIESYLQQEGTRDD